MDDYKTKHQLVELSALWTGPQLAAYLGVNNRTIEGWRRKKEGPRYIRLGGRDVRYRVTDVHAWLEASESDRGTAA